MNMKELLETSHWRLSLEGSYEAQKAFNRALNRPVYEALEDKWRYYEIRGKYGMVYPYSADYLVVYFNSKIIGRRFEERWTKHRDGDIETEFLVPSTELDAAATAVRARKKRRLNPDQIRRLADARKEAKNPH